MSPRLGRPTQSSNIDSYAYLILISKSSPKLLIDRLTPMADKLISSNQATFIKERNILEWVVILHEILHEFRKSRK
jgi:hypothetical protein